VGNYQTEEADPSQWEAMEWRCFEASLLYDIWDKAERDRDPHTWRTFDFAVLVEDDEEEDASPTANVECDSQTTVSGD